MILKNNPHIKLYLLFFILTVATVIIGTLTHEFGHFIMAKFMGHQSVIHYSNITNPSPLGDSLSALFNRYEHELRNHISFPEEHRYNQLLGRFSYESVWVSIGGPAITIFTATVSLFFIVYYQSKSWLLIFASLCWLRQPLILCQAAIMGLFSPTATIKSDENKIEQYFGLPSNLIVYLTGIAGLLVFVYILFKVVPSHIRWPFVMMLFWGSIVGYVIWFYWLGPFLLP